MWWRRKPKMTKSLRGLSVMNDEHLDYLYEQYKADEGYGIIKDRLSFGRYVELEQKIKWEA